MENDSFIAMVKRILSNGFKNKQILGVAIIAPILIMIVLGYMVTMAGVQDPVKIGVVNNDQGMGNIKASSSIIEELKGQTNVTVVEINQDDITRDLNDKTITAALVFPENFTVDLARENAEVTLVLEGTDQAMNIMASRAVSTSVASVAARSANITQPLNVNLDNLYGDGLDFTDLFMYRFMVLVTLILSMIVALTAVIKDKGTDYFQGMLEYPVKSTLAYILGLCLFGFIIVSIILAFLIYIMGVTIVGSVIDAVLLMFLISLVGISLGILCTSITRKKTQAFGIFGLLLVLQVMFSGLFIPVSRFDYYTQLISYSLPLTYALDAMKDITIRGFVLGDVGIDITALLVILIVTLLISVIGLKAVQKKEDV